MIHLNRFSSLLDKKSFIRPFLSSVIQSKAFVYLLQILLALKRKRYDWSFSSIVLWYRAIVSLLWFIFYRYIRQRRDKAINRLVRINHSLIKINNFSVIKSRIQRSVENSLKQAFSREGSAHYCLKFKYLVTEKNLRPFMEGKAGIVLKAPRFVGERVIEKGVLVLRGYLHFRTFRYCLDVASVLRHYVLVLEPGWSGLCNSDILYFTRFFEQPIIVMAADDRDFKFLRKLETNLIPVRFSNNDWIDPAIFHPLKDQEKIYDAVMVARWVIFKRHHVLFRVLHDLRDPSFKVALVGLPPPGKRKELELLINAYGIDNNVRVFERVPRVEVNKILNQSKVNLFLSLVEGANKALVEGFFAGIPGIALKKNYGIQKNYLTSYTGKLIDEKDLGKELLYFRKHWTNFEPRAWAEANITPEITTAKLNKLLKDLALRRGECWTQDIVAKCNSPPFKYYPDEKVGKGLPSIEDILVQYARSKEIRDMIGRSLRVVA